MKKLLFFAFFIVFSISACGSRTDAVNDVILELQGEENNIARMDGIGDLFNVAPPGSRDWEDDGSILGYQGPVSILTGLPLNEEYINRRPLAVIVNNIHVALPQSGITSADIIYEMLSEGDITRLIAIYQSYIPEKIGPVRSARDYFVDFAFNHDAIFIHHGASESGYSRIRGSQITVLDGMALEGSVFWRDRTYPAWAGISGQRPLEHSSYTGWTRIYTHLYSRNLRREINDDPNLGFIFGIQPNEPTGIAERVTIPFSPGYPRIFIFDSTSGLYYVEHRAGQLLDAVTQEQVTVTNILIQLTVIQNIAGDAAGRRTVRTTGEGTGYLITGGTYRPVTWASDGTNSPTRWYFEDGTPLVLTPGRTWICILQSNATPTFE